MTDYVVVSWLTILLRFRRLSPHTGLSALSHEIYETILQVLVYDVNSCPMLHAQGYVPLQIVCTQVLRGWLHLFSAVLGYALGSNEKSKLDRVRNVPVFFFFFYKKMYCVSECVNSNLLILISMS